MKHYCVSKIFVFTLCFAIFAFLFSCQKKESQQVPTAKAIKGTFYIDMHEEGEIEAINSINISSPSISWRYGNLKITQLVKDGQEVNAGDTLITFDQSEVQKGIVDAEGRLEISRAELERMLAEQESTLEELNADYEIARISHEISKISLDAAGHESEIKKKEIQLNLDRAGIALDRAKEQIENRKKIQLEELKQKNLSIEQDKARLNEAYETLNKLYVVTPSPGISIISHNWSSGNKFQIGDQCWSGFPIIQLPDLSKLKATIHINEVDIAKIVKGLKVEIKPDAFSDSTFAGHVNSIANLAVNKRDSKIKVFPVEVLLDKSDKNLLPGLTVSCRVIIDEIKDVVYIPVDAVKSEGDKNYVFKQSGDKFNKVEVETGESNTDYIVIKKGLNEGDKVALADPLIEMEKDKKKEKDSKIE